MTSLRQFRPMDLLRTSLTNLDPLTENYDLGFYLQYLATWPKLFTVAEDAHGDIIGYMMGKTEADPPHRLFSPHYTPWHGHVTALTVAPPARRLGLARALTGALEAACERAAAYFVDLYVRASNATAAILYRGLGYTVFRRVVAYYSDDPTGRSPAGEDAFDMRKPLARDKDRKYVRETGGEEFRVDPEDLYA